jgi:hypothetical protein
MLLLPPPSPPPSTWIDITFTTLICGIDYRFPVFDVAITPF